MTDTRTTYRLQTESGVAYVAADLTRASSGVMVYFGCHPAAVADGDADDDGFAYQPTPYQTADAHHREDELAEIIASYFELGDVIAIEAI